MQGVVRLVRSGLEQERQLLDDPSAVAGAVAAIEQANARIEHLRGPGARWSVLVNDRISDLTTNVTHACAAGCARSPARWTSASRSLKKGDEWDEVTRTCRRGWPTRSTRAFVAVEQGDRSIRAEAVELLAEEQLDLGTSRATAGRRIDVASMWRDKSLDGDETRPKAFKTGLTGARGAQGGVMMFGMMGSFLPGAAAVLIATNPVLLGAGALFGGMQLIEDRKRKVAQRRQSARQQVRQFIDDVQFEVTNELSGLIREAHREIRDEFTTRLAELQRTYTRQRSGRRPTPSRPRSSRPARRARARPAARRARRKIAQVVAEGGARCNEREHRRRRARSSWPRNVEQLVKGTPYAPRAQAIVERLQGPLRVAIAGRVKAGKSTLLNALVGERLAPTDAGECTRLVSWYRHGIGYQVAATLPSGEQRELSFSRDDGALDIELGDLAERDVGWLDVQWPASTLKDVTLIDTPGLASINDDNSRRTRDFLEHDETNPTDADAVIYLMRHLHRSDVEFLDAFMDRSVTAASPVNAVAVLSRADEIGAGRLDAMDSARRIAERYRNDPAVQRLAATVVPIAGLLAETGLTLREDEAGRPAHAGGHARRRARADAARRRRLLRCPRQRADRRGPPRPARPPRHVRCARRRRARCAAGSGHRRPARPTARRDLRPR